MSHRRHEAHQIGPLQCPAPPSGVHGSIKCIMREYTWKVAGLLLLLTIGLRIFFVDWSPLQAQQLVRLAARLQPGSPAATKIDYGRHIYQLANDRYHVLVTVSTCPVIPIV